MIFRFKEKDYTGTSALEIVRKIEMDTKDYPFRGQPIRQFLLWSLNRLGNYLPPRELDLSTRLEDETLALSYLHLCDEYGAGKIIRMPLKFTQQISTLKS
jgi:hypothetical protein